MSGSGKGWCRGMEISILFSTPMVQAILANIKRMTRRTRGLDKINKNPDQWEFVEMVGRSAFFQNKKTGELRYIRCPYGQPGDTLWLRETWCKNPYGTGWPYVFKASPETWLYDEESEHQWRPSIFMPREAARLFLTNKKVRVERLQGITEEDAKAEGCPRCIGATLCGGCDGQCEPNNPKLWFQYLWDSLNAKRGYGWEKNPWAWVVEFEKQ